MNQGGCEQTNTPQLGLGTGGRAFLFLDGCGLLQSPTDMGSDQKDLIYIAK